MAGIEAYLQEHPEVILVFVGLIFGSIGGYFLWTTLSFWRRALCVPGTVTGLYGETEAHVGGIDFRIRGQNLLRPVLQFTTREGREVETAVSLGARPMPARPGDEVTVSYDPTDPTTAEMTIWYRLSFSLIFLAIGLAAIGLSVLAILGSTLNFGLIIPGVLAGLALPFTLLGATTLWTALQVRRIGYCVFGGFFLVIGLLMLGSSSYLVFVIMG